MGEAIRNIARRKIRSGLTIFGIVIGTFALTVMGGMTENFSRQIDGAIRIVGNTIDVNSKKQINLTTVRRIERVEGVQAVVRSLGSTLVEDEDEESPGITFGPPNTVFGIAPQYDTVFFKGVRLQDGRWLERGDTYKTVLGSNVAANKQVGVGDTIIWLKKKLTVVGVMESTQTFPDNFAVVPFETVRRVQRIPLWVVGSIAVIPESPQITEEVAKRITKQVPWRYRRIAGAANRRYTPSHGNLPSHRAQRLAARRDCRRSLGREHDDYVGAGTDPRDRAEEGGRGQRWRYRGGIPPRSGDDGAARWHFWHRARLHPRPSAQRRLFRGPLRRVALCHHPAPGGPHHDVRGGHRRRGRLVPRLERVAARPGAGAPQHLTY